MDRMFNKRRKEKGEGDGKNVLSAGFSSSLVFSLVLSQSKFNNWIKARKKYKKNYLDKIYSLEK